MVWEDYRPIRFGAIISAISTTTRAPIQFRNGFRDLVPKWALCVIVMNMRVIGF